MQWTENTLNKATATRACTLAADYTEMRKSCMNSRVQLTA